MQRDSFLADATRVLQQLQFVDQLITFVLVLPAERIGIRAFLYLGAFEGIRGVSGAGGVAKLMDLSALARVEPLVVAAEVQVSFRQSYALYRPQLAVHGKQHL